MPLLAWGHRFDPRVSAPLQMNKHRYSAVLVLLMGVAFCVGYLCHRPSTSGTAGSSARPILYYHDPMHPSYRSDKPGIAPDCGMSLEPVYADGGGPPTPQIPGLVQVSPERQQITGVRVRAVEKAPGTHSLRLFGRVAPDEGRVYRLTAGVDGLVRDVSRITTGSQVEKGQVLATFSAPEVFSAVQAYLVALGAIDRMRESGSPPLADPTRGNIQQRFDTLELIGMSSAQIEEIGRDRSVPQAVRILSPANGFVLERSVTRGQRFEHGAELFRIADLSRVWILADLFGREETMVRPGMTASVRLPGQDLAVTAKVSEVLPQFDPATLSLKVRLEADNPRFVLRPDMFVDVELLVSLPPAIAVPVDAVLDSGLTKTVFVDRGEGFFEPRSVRTGWRLGDRVEILEGLRSGERIVVSGTFLIDSESRMKSNTAAAIESAVSTRDPVCGMSVDESKARAAGRMREHLGKSYYFCSDGCKTGFAEDPGRFIRVAGGAAQSSGEGRDHRLD